MLTFEQGMQGDHRAGLSLKKRHIIKHLAIRLVIDLHIEEHPLLRSIVSLEETIEKRKRFLNAPIVQKA